MSLTLREALQNLTVPDLKDLMLHVPQAPTGTRKDELLLSPDEFSVVHKLRRVLSGLDSHQAIDLLMSQLRKTKTNYEFLVQVSKTAPGSADSD